MTGAGMPVSGPFDVDAPIVPPSALPEDFVLRDAQPRDASGIAWILQQFASRGLVLPRTEAEVADTLDEFGVCEHGGTVVGCTSLHTYTPELAEIRSLAVREGCQRHGLGGKLVAWGMERAATQGLTRVFALTYRARFFERLGFSRIPRARLPEKVWGDCRRCPKAEFCDEVAVVREVAGWGAGDEPRRVL